MKSLLLFILSILFISPCFSQLDLLPAYPNEISYKGERAYFNGSPFTGILVDEKTNKQLGKYNNGFKNGLFTEYYTNGKKKNEGKYTLGLIEGAYTEWFENGNKKSELSYNNGAKEGKQQVWYENGQKQFELNFTNDVLNGIQQEWFENGNKKGEVSYNNGAKEGKQQLWNENGQKQSETNFTNDVLNGIQQEWFENGNIKSEENYLNGKPDGYNVYYNNNNSKQVEVLFHNGEILKSTEWNSDGTIKSSFEYTFTDPRDDKTYKIVKIGTQTWMAENLAYKTDNGCWAYNNDESNVATYGYLYNWETAKKVCPTGWHLPTDDEWTTLTNYLGGESVAGKKMKVTSINSPAWNGTNTCGFTALPAGYRANGDGSFGSMGSGALFWSATEDSGTDAWYRDLSTGSSQSNRSDNNKADGFSVRCLQD